MAEEKDLEVYLEKDTFWKVLGVYSSIIVLAAGFFWSRLDKIENDYVTSKVAFAEIRLTLNSIQVDLLEIKEQLEQHTDDTRFDTN